MDADRFDHLSRALIAITPRRSILTAIVTLAAPLTLLSDATFGKKNKRKQRRKTIKRKLKKHPIVFNDLGCVDQGKHCRHGVQCCSGDCRGPKGQQSCRDHDRGICFGESPCGTGPTVCGNHEPGVSCFCFITSGGAFFCGHFGVCRACAKDAECEADFGEGAACVRHDCVCTTTGGRACASRCNDPV